MVKHRILVVDDSKLSLKVLATKLNVPQFAVTTTSAVSEAVNLLKNADFDIVITDKVMPDYDGLDIIRHVRENFSQTGIIMMTGHATMEGAIEAVKSGADEYLEKPVKDLELFPAIERVLQKLSRQKHASTTESAKQSWGIVGQSPAIYKLLNAIPKVASVPATVLITGDSGTGKELVARAIHYASARARGPFVAVNCSAIPETLLESELFGSIKGAYTGSSVTRDGYFASAQGGTIFLDEISSTSPSLQSKLLRVVQEKEVVQIGADMPRKIDVKIITATNKNLLELVQKDSFRKDLFYRLNVLSIDIPPLAERGDDVLLLLHHFTLKYATEFARAVPTFTDEALRAFANYSWPGNIRELENLIQRLVAMGESDVIDIQHLPTFMRYSLSPKHSHFKSLAEVEREHIDGVLHAVKGNKTRAAEILGIDRKTLREKLKRLATV